MADNKHDLFDFFQEANKKIEAEYARISRSAGEDPGTAGDQGELNWKSLLEQWLPPYFQVVTKGRILNENGETSPQMDVLILSPEYPRQLVECKRYLSKGVVAVFECKTTLRKENIRELFDNAKKLQRIIGQDAGTPRKELQSRIFYGLLAHSHDWKRDNSKPKENVTKIVEECLSTMIEHPIEMPDMLCVADLGIWRSFKLIIPPQPLLCSEDVEKNREEGFDRLTVRSGYTESTSSTEMYTPVGAMVFQILEELAWKYSGMRNICDYMRKLGVEGSGEGKMKFWNPDDVLSQDVLKNSGLLNTGRFWDEWSMIVR